MKKTFKYLAAAFAVTAAVSCAKQEELAPEESNTPTGTYQYTLNVSQESTKVSMDGLSILWSADDQIAIGCSYDSGYKNAKASGGAQSIENPESYTPSTSATFTLNLTADYKPLTAAYPYFDAMTTTSGKSINNGQACTAIIPAIQTGVKDNVPSEAFAMVGRIIDSNCKMYNVGAVIKFDITNDNIASLRFEGNNSEIISGRRFYFTKVEDGSSDTVGAVAKEYENEGTTSVTLVPSGDVFEVGSYYFVVSPNDLTEGFTMTLTTTDGQTSVRKTSTRFNIERNHKYTNFGSDDWAIDIATGAAGNLGSADGTTATLYAIVSGDDIAEGDTYGFEISSDGENWTKYDGTIGRRTSVTASYNTLNVLTASMTGLVPETTMYYRAYYTTGTGATTHGTTRSFKTYANAESAIMYLYNGWDSNYWPFPDLTVGEHIYKGNSAAAVSKGTEFTMTTASGHEFTAKATGGVWLGNSNGCLTMKVSAGDYLKLPSVAGKKPISVTVVAGNIGGSGVMGKPSIASIEDESYTTVTGGGPWAPKPNYKYNSYTWEIVTDSEDNAIYFNAGDNCYISYIEVVYVNANTDTRPAEIEQNLIFYDYTGNHSSEPALSNGQKLWPFNGATSSPHPKFVEDVEFQGPYYTTNNPEIQYLFKVQSYTKSDCWRVTGQGFRFGGTVDDYMSFQPVEGYKLTYIKIRGGNKAACYSVKDKDGNITAGGDQQTIKNSFDSTVEFKLTETSANTEYHLVLGSTEPSAIREMWITYELVK